MRAYLANTVLTRILYYVRITERGKKMLSKQFKDAVFYQDQFLTKWAITEDKCRLEYVFENVHDRYDTVTAIVCCFSSFLPEAYVFHSIDKQYVRFDEDDIGYDDDEDVPEDIFDCYSYDLYNNLNDAIISVMHDCPDDDDTFRPHFYNYADMISFYEKMKAEHLVTNIEAFLTEQVCNDFNMCLESVLEAYKAGVPLEDILVDD